LTGIFSTPIRNALALSGTTSRSAAGWLGRNGFRTRAYAAGLFQPPKSSVTSVRMASASKSPTMASSALLAP